MNDLWLESSDFARLVGVSPRMARKAIGRRMWYGNALAVRQIADRAGGANGNIRHQILLTADLKAAILARNPEAAAELDRLTGAPPPSEPEPPPASTQGEADRPNPVTADPDALKTYQRQVQEARRAILLEVARRQFEFNGRREPALRAVVADVAAGRLHPAIQEKVAIANARAGNNRTLSVRTLKRWLAAARDDAVNLAPKPAATTEAPIPPWAAHFLRHYQRPQKPSVAHALRALERDELPPDIPIPNYHQVRHFLKNFSAYDRERGRRSGADLKQFGFSHRRTANGMQPMIEVHADGWATHFIVPHPESGHFMTMEIWHFHDIATRFVFPPSIGLSESFMTITRGLKNCIALGGVPAVFQTDCTGSVKNDRFEADPVTSIADRAGISIVHTLAGNPAANGICENFNKYLDSEARELATYTGKDMDRLVKNQVIRITQKLVKATHRDEQRALKVAVTEIGKGKFLESWQQATDWINTKIADYNQHHEHSALPKIQDPQTGRLRHQTPLEAWQDALEHGWAPVTLTPAELEDLFRPHVRAKVRKGKIQLYGQYYTHPELKHWAEQELMVAYDLEEGSRIWVKALDGRQICEAEYYEPRGFRARSFVEMALEKRADAQQKRLHHKIDVVEDSRPGRTLENQQAADAAVVAAQAARADLDAELAAPPPEPPREETDPQKFRRWLNYQSQQDTLPEAELCWMKGWETSAAFRAMKALYDDFGPAFLGDD